MTDKPVVLIVDDEPVNIQIMAAALTADYEICFACNGDDAMRLAARTAPALILLDVTMPGKDGYEVCRQLKQDPQMSDIPVIFTTARDGAQDELRGLSLGAIDYIVKPVRPQLLRRRVENHIALKRLRDQLMQQAVTDPLTGLGSRRLLDSRLPEEVRRLSRDLEWLSLVMLDVDFFKQFNDAYGHPAGDTCLQNVADALSSSLHRAGDVAVRYGGEEFACLLPGVDPAGARLMGEKLRRQVKGLAIPHSGSAIASEVTVSLGVASARCEPDSSPAQWLSEADRMLYVSKSGGRDRVSTVVMDPRRRLRGGGDAFLIVG